MTTLKHPRFYSLVDQCIQEPPQKSDEWFNMRKGKLSGSKLSNFLFIQNQAERVKFFEEVFEGRKREAFSDEQKEYMEWGVQNEDRAMFVFLNFMPHLMAFEAPMVQHTEVKYLSASPDGFYEIRDNDEVIDTGVIEIKCGGKTKKAYDRVKYYYVPQVYLEMAVSGKRNAIFISWGLDYTRAWRIEWNDKFWESLSNMIRVFVNTKNSKWDEYAKAKFFLRRECASVVKAAVPLHPGKGWPSSV